MAKWGPIVRYDNPLKQGLKHPARAPDGDWFASDMTIH